MSPFLYLQICRIKNAFRRSFKTPVRGFMTVLLIGYFVFVLTLIFTLEEHKVTEAIHPLDMRFPLALLTLAHLIPLLYALPPPKYVHSIFSDTDIANLYQAPMRPWRVFKFFFFSRTFAGYCLFFLIVAFYGIGVLRVSLPGIFVHTNNESRVFWNIIYIAMVLLSLAGLLFWRLIFDIRREFNLIRPYVFSVSVFIILGFIATIVGYSVVKAYALGLGFQTGIVKCVEFLPLSVLLVPFRLFAQLFLVHADLSSVSFWFGVAFWIILATSGYYVLRAHNLLLYEYAFRLAEFRSTMVMRMRSPAQRLKEMHHSGKKVMRLPWFVRLMQPRKAGAIFWLDMVITWRSFGTALKWIQGVLLIGVIAGWTVLKFYDVSVKSAIVWTLSGSAMFVASWPLSIVSTLGFSEVLRRVEIQKPIPISALHTVTMHILQWTAMTCSVTLVPFLTAFVLLGRAGYPVLFVLIAGWSFMHCMISGYFLITLYNPDMYDPIQRMYAMVFGLAISAGASIPGCGVLVGSLLMHAPLILVLSLLVSANLASAGALHYLSARKYTDFVPTE